MVKLRALSIPVLIICLASSCSLPQDRDAAVSSLEPSGFEYIGEVDERYQSINIEMCEVVGGDFWIPYDLLDTSLLGKVGFAALRRTIPPIDLYEEKLRTLAGALGPMYVRVSGTWANSTFFQDDDEPKLTAAPDGFENVLTRKEWKGVTDFCQALDARLVTSFAISDGIRDKQGRWTPAQAGSLIQYTGSIGGEIYAAEMFNEPSHAGYGGAPEAYDGAYYAEDFSRFRSHVDSVSPEMQIMGPGSTGEGGILGDVGSMSSDSILSADPMPEFEIFSYHFYGGVSKRCMGELTPENALTEEWLSKTELGLQYYEDTRDKYLPGTPIWLTETAEAACGGNPWAATYIDCFRYLEQLGRLAKKGVQVVMHNTLAASEYALLEQDSHEPRPNYWAALLWSRLMGTRVFDPGVTSDKLDVFVHDLKGTPDAFAVLIINPTDAGSSINIPVKGEQYLFTADELLTKKVKLNGEVLALNPDQTLPEIRAQKTRAGKIQIPPYSIMFLAVNFE